MELLILGFASALFSDSKISKYVALKGQVGWLLRMAHQPEKACSAPNRYFNAPILAIRAKIIHVICLSVRFFPIYIFISIVCHSVCF